ncbi:AfsR/SARP family transcriptional regulator [Anaerovorax odorimutans]|uniref:AfsR/SARP family transcriptional regulator n=1 Tax=Anaerovorax odorimutans TaxID=109327 RepID=UPI000417B5FD|nr:BTAD domain-containing putative transcriptional regulator [Anaerovorax odorimutans]
MLLKYEDNINSDDTYMVSKENILHIQMLSDFVLRYNGNVLSGDKVRAKKIWDLLEYMLVNRNKDISTEKLINILWREDDIEDPANALKNLVYRLRKLLKNSLDLPASDYIIYRHGTYVWNPDFSCIFDIDVFEEYCNKAKSANLTKEEKINLYKKALSIYKGNFLPQSAYKGFVIPLEVYYQRMYMDAAKELCYLLKEHNDYKDIEEVCRNACTIDPFDETNHILLIKALLSNKNQKKAIEHYEVVYNLFQKELGIKPSQEINKLYYDMMNRELDFEKDISVINKDLKEAEELGGALLCNYEMFKKIYRLQARAMARLNNSIFIVLLTIEVNPNNYETRIEPEIIEKIKDIILASLRKDDVVTQYSNKQFLIMLANLTRKNINAVLNRIKQRLRNHYQMNSLEFYEQIEILDPVELIK